MIAADVFKAFDEEVLDKSELDQHVGKRYAFPHFSQFYHLNSY